MTKKILINAFGINDSGGITVFSKLLEECRNENRYTFLIVCHENENINQLINSYKQSAHITFYIIQNKSILQRLWYENICFSSIIKNHSVSLVYNFTGSGQFFSKVPQITKIHNLLFYSEQLERVYFKQRKYLQWIKQIYIKRLVFLTMLQNVKYIEVQSEHVKQAIGNFISIKKKHFFIKSDITIDENRIEKIRSYDFEKPLILLYIVGPHFSLLHKNVIDFVDAMCLLHEEKISFSIKITLTQKQLEESGLWEKKLNDKTEFLGYIKDKQELKALFQNNTILISTSIIETLGLHVIEATLNGILAIVPNEDYAKSVYGKDTLNYDLFNPPSLADKILTITSKNTEECYARIKKQQQYLIMNESSKMNHIFDIFDTVLRDSNV